MTMDLLRLTGEIVSIGDLRDEEVPKLVGVPHVLLRTADGRTILVSGLTREECRACVSGFMAPASITIGAE